ncbi:hypothetical protein A2U01_0005435, partial [Trifolium medium]|nr:hypothetical protein [Trifolium medium]
VLPDGRAAVSNGSRVHVER